MEGFLGEVAPLPWLKPLHFFLYTTVPASSISLPASSSAPPDCMSFYFVLERNTKLRLLLTANKIFPSHLRPPTPRFSSWEAIRSSWCLGWDVGSVEAST